MGNLFLVSGENDQTSGISVFSEGLSQSFAGLRIDEQGVVIYFHFDQTEQVDKLLRHSQVCKRMIEDAGFVAEQTNFGIIKGGEGPFQLAYRIRKPN